MRPRLAKPLGRLFQGAEIGGTQFREIVASSTTLVSVGDRVTDTLWRLGRTPDVQLVDGRENRKDRAPSAAPFARVIQTKNPPGTITESAIEAIREAFRGVRPSRVLVEGEEDLLAIPAVVLAPESSLVFYGQPGVGMVLVVADERAKSLNSAILREMGVPPIA